MTEQIASSTITGNHDDAEYVGFLGCVNARFLANCATYDYRLFMTDVQDLWTLYLDSFDDPVVRQYHNCHACKGFIERFGGLVTIDADGITQPVIWDVRDAPETLSLAVGRMARAVRRAAVTGVFLSSLKVWGKPVTDSWLHLAVFPPASIVFPESLPSSGQKMAAKAEDYKAVASALSGFMQEDLNKAVAILKTDALYRSEKILGQAEWLRDLKERFTAAHYSNRSNVLWRAVAIAPAGFCHPRASMIGTLLEDIAAGMDFAVVSRRFATKMHPLQYQRPQAPPSSGAIDAAEKIVQQLGASGSLARRFCRVDEVEALWKPAPKPEISTDQSVFGHLRNQAAPMLSLDVPAQTMTWEKFQRTVLPNAERIRILAPSIGNYAALVTAVNPDAPPILQWDNEHNRNPVSWYVWMGGASAKSFGLRSEEFHDVEVITLQPSMWHGGLDHQGKSVIFVISGARESRSCGTALFPEILRADLHGIRSVIEAHSRASKIEGLGEQHASGLMLQAVNGSWNALLQVLSRGCVNRYLLDRWD